MRTFGVSPRRLTSTGVATLLSLAAPVVPAAAQATTALVGVVLDSAGHAVPGATVNVAGTAIQVRTNDIGGFRMAAVPVGVVQIGVRRFGFAPLNTEVTLRAARRDSLVIRIEVMVASLEGVVVEDEATRRILAGFRERRSRGFGSFMTREEIEARQTHDFAELLRMMPSARIARVGGRNTIRFKRSMSGRDCPPQFWIDGMRLERAEADEFNVSDVEALEVYAGPATVPMQFASRPNANTCGAVVIWTRVQ